MKKRILQNLRKSGRLVGFLLVIGLIIGISLPIFAHGAGNGGGFGPDKEIEVKISNSDWKVFYPALKNYIDSLKALVNKEVESGIISKYQAKGINDEIDEAFEKIIKTKTIELMPGFGYMGNGYMGNRPFNNQKQYGAGRGRYMQNNMVYRLTDAQWNKIYPYLKKLEQSKTNFYSAMFKIGLITKIQYDNMVKNSADNFKYLTDNKIFRPFYGLVFILHMAD